MRCEHGKRRLSWDQINDNYCDCPTDGMDEPGTSACENGRFWCGEEEDKYIFSSRVNDGRCGRDMGIQVDAAMYVVLEGF